MSPKLIIALVIGLLPIVAMAGPKVSATDQAALQHRHDVNLMEIEMGKLAIDRGTEPVKKYATALVKDHVKSDKDVVALARAKGIKLEEHAPGPDHDTMLETMAKLKALEGTAFDQAYLRAMVDGHTAEVGKITTSIGKVTDAKIKALLTKAKPVVERHAEQARALLTPATASTMKP